MNLKWYYWYFQSALPERICDEIVKYGKDQEKQMALTGHAGGKKTEELTEEEIQNIQKKRKSDIVWMNQSWIYNEIQPYIHIANRNES